MGYITMGGGNREQGEGWDGCSLIFCFLVKSQRSQFVSAFKSICHLVSLQLKHAFLSFCYLFCYDG